MSFNNELFTETYSLPHSLYHIQQLQKLPTYPPLTAAKKKLAQTISKDLQCMLADLFVEFHYRSDKSSKGFYKILSKRFSNLHILKLKSETS